MSNRRFGPADVAAYLNRARVKPQQTPPAPQRRSLQLELAGASGSSMHAPRSNDPYNTSGSFDRKKNWERVAKR